MNFTLRASEGKEVRWSSFQNIRILKRISCDARIYFDYRLLLILKMLNNKLLLRVLDWLGMTKRIFFLEFSYSFDKYL